MFLILITATAILIAEWIAWTIAGHLRQHTAGLYDHLANGDSVLAPGSGPHHAKNNLIASPKRYADIWITALALVLTTVVIAYPLVPAAAIFARYINKFLLASFWVSIILGICAAFLLVLGFLDYRARRQLTQLRLAVFLGLMAIIFGGLTWLVYSPPLAPDGYEQAFYQLVAFPLSDTNWTQMANNLLGEYRSQTEFLFMQVIGLPFMLVSLLDVLYILGCSLYAHLTQRIVPISVNILILGPILAGATSIFFGIF